MAAEPLHTVETDRFTVTFMIDEGDDLDALSFNDALIVLPDGTRWSATFATLAGLATVMDNCAENGVLLDGTYFQCPDLVIVRDGGVSAMVDVIQGILEHEYEDFGQVFRPLPPADDDDDLRA